MLRSGLFPEARRTRLLRPALATLAKGHAMTTHPARLTACGEIRTTRPGRTGAKARGFTMGEYATSPSGRQIKLGTCENLYYVTRADVEALASAGWHGDGGNKDLRTYLGKPFRSRVESFSEPAGDPDIIDARDPWSFATGIRVPMTDGMREVIRAEVEHGSIYHECNGRRLILPCPCGKEWNSNGTQHGTLSVSIVAVGHDPERLVFLCPGCEWPFNLHGNPAIGDVLEHLQRSKPLNGVPDRRLEYLIRIATAGVEAIEPATT